MTQEEQDKAAAALRKVRNDSKESEGEDDGSLALEEEGGVSDTPAKDHTITFVLAFLVAVFSDLADIFIIGAIPLVGDALDAVTGIILAALFLPIGGRKKMRRLAPVIGATVIEFLPFGITDVLPTFTLEVIFTWYTVKKENRTGEQ